MWTIVCHFNLERSFAMTQLSYHTSDRATITCDGPQFIVLDTAGQLSALIPKIQRFPFLMWERDELISFILQAIAYEQQAALELDYSCMEIVTPTVGVSHKNQADFAVAAQFVQESDNAANAISQFGKAIIDQLRAIRAYSRGYLFYSFHSWAGNDIVLTKLYLDKDPEKVEPAP